MEVLLIFLGFAVIYFIVSHYNKNISNNGSSLIIEEELKKYDFKGTQKYLNSNSMKYISIDEENHKICLCYQDNIIKSKYNTHIYDYSDILEIEIIENGNSISKMSKSSVAGRAILGGILLGGVGAVIGGFTANKNNFESIKRIYLRLIVNNTTEPIFEIDFYNDIDGEGIKNNTNYYSSVMHHINHWYGLFRVIIKKDDESYHE